MKVLITGGLGFQGAHLTKHLLQKGHEVTVLNTLSEDSENHLNFFDQRPKIIWGSVTDKELVRKSVREHEVVFHLAARINVDESIEDPLAFFDVNINGTVNILEAVREQQNRLIYASTCEVYGVSLNQHVLNEESALRPHSPYAASKAAADRICFSYCKSFGTNVTVVRPFNIYGEGQKEGQFGALIPILVKRALDGQNLNVFGTGLQTRDYMNVSDLVDAYDLILNSDHTAGEVYNFGTGIETSVKSIAEYIAKKFGVMVEYGVPRPGEVTRFCADITKATQLGFSAKVDIWQGIDRYIDWRKNQNK